MATAPTGAAKPLIATMAKTRSQVRFLLGPEPVSVALDDPTTTLLEYLRVSAALTGTKEGCAEGDCGACTVLLGELNKGRLRYTPANACILLLGMVDGKQVITVEHASHPEPHPVQRAMVDCDASQCGFCTPGFVMSLIGLQVTQAGTGVESPPSREAIDQALAGNLCRCTGYGPIIVAAQRACGQPLSDDWKRMATRAETMLLEWDADPRALRTSGTAGSFETPRTSTTLSQALQRQPAATLVAGATDVGLWITKHTRAVADIVHIGDIDALKQIHNNDTGLHIGAAVLLADLADVLGTWSPDIARVLSRFGGVQVRSRGTVGGNIANGSPIGDLAPLLIALNAQLSISGPSDPRTLALENFFLRYGEQDLQAGEFIDSILVPACDLDGFSCWKVSKRFDQDISAVLGAFNLVFENASVREARICFGGMAGLPQRASACESALLGQPFNRDTLAAAKIALATDFEPLSDMRATAHYRQRVASNLLERYFLNRMTGEILPELYPSTRPSTLRHA